MKNSHYSILFADQAIAAAEHRKTRRAPAVLDALELAARADQADPMPVFPRMFVIMAAAKAQQCHTDHADPQAVTWVGQPAGELVRVRAYFRGHWCAPPTGGMYCTWEQWQIFRLQVKHAIFEHF